MNTIKDSWIIKDSANSVAVTADKMEAIIENAPPKLFARIDHGAGAASVDAELSDAILMIFGAPEMGTPIMRQNIMAGFDLPVKVLIWDESGQTKIGYLNPEAFKARYEIEGADASFEMMAGAVGKITDGAAK